jgi:leader peptidase (prepilin peptidase) / N-methyltransferase
MSAQLVWAFGIGLLWGSFANVLIYRLPRMVMAADTTLFNLSKPASHCPHCQTPLRVWHNIPLISFVLLRGQCAHCGARIRLQYPMIELLTGGIWAACAWQWGFSPTAACWALLGTSLLALAVIDWQTTLLPDLLTQALVWGGLIASSLGTIDIDLSLSVWGAALGYGSLWLVATAFKTLTQKEGMGAGDFKLLAALGAWLGPWALIPLVLLASIAGAVVGIGLKLTHRLNEDGYIPFGPFLAAAGALIAWLGLSPFLRIMSA